VTARKDGQHDRVAEVGTPNILDVGDEGSSPSPITKAARMVLRETRFQLFRGSLFDFLAHETKGGF